MGAKALKMATRHVVLIIGIALILLPVYMALVASTHPAKAMTQSPIPFYFGKQGYINFKHILTQGLPVLGNKPVLLIMLNSFIMALFIACGKIFVSLLSAYALVYFEFRFKKTIFWLIFLTLMLPVEVRIVPTFQVVSNLHLINHYAGLTLPLIASATATFLFRQFFLTIPKNLLEAAQLDGAGAYRFFKDILLPLSKTNIAALFIIMFIYGWNQYLWPLVVTTGPEMTTIVMGIQSLASIADQVPQWNYIMAIAVCAMLPPLIIIVLMQRLFQKGLLETEK